MRKNRKLKVGDRVELNRGHRPNTGTRKGRIVAGAEGLDITDAVLVEWDDGSEQLNLTADLRRFGPSYPRKRT